MSLKEKTDAIDRCFKARYRNVNHRFQYMSLWKWVKELLDLGHWRDQRQNFPTAADQGPESTSERPTCFLLVKRMMRFIKSRGAFTIRSDYKPGSQSRSFLSSFSLFPPLPISPIHSEMSWEKFVIWWYTLENLRLWHDMQFAVEVSYHCA